MKLIYAIIIILSLISVLFLESIIHYWADDQRQEKDRFATWRMMERLLYDTLLLFVIIWSLSFIKDLNQMKMYGESWFSIVELYFSLQGEEKQNLIIKSCIIAASATAVSLLSAFYDAEESISLRIRDFFAYCRLRFSEMRQGIYLVEYPRYWRKTGDSGVEEQ